MTFENPTTGARERVTHPWLWTLLLGSLYFAAKKNWTHAAVSAVIGFLTLGLSWLVYPFFAAHIVRSHYLRQGWIEVDDSREDLAEAA